MFFRRFRRLRLYLHKTYARMLKHVRRWGFFLNMPLLWDILGQHPNVFRRSADNIHATHLVAADPHSALMPPGMVADRAVGTNVALFEESNAG
jgi:hypothetical protein